MGEEELRLFIKKKKDPISNVEQLGKKLIGTREGMFFYTEKFRLDFENKMYLLGDYKNKLQRIENYLDRHSDIPMEVLVNIKNIIHSEESVD